MDLVSYLTQETSAALADIPEEDRPDVYVVSLFVYDEDDEPNRPTVTVGTNTERQVRSALAGESDARSSPFDESEARWNFAFWRQDDLACLCHSVGDPAGTTLRDGWIGVNGWTLDWEVEHADETAVHITNGFVEACVQAAQRVHESGLLERLFTRSVPVIVHELEYYDEIAEQNLRANPAGLVEPFVGWIKSMWVPPTSAPNAVGVLGRSADLAVQSGWIRA